MESRNAIVLKVGGKTNQNALKTAIISYLKNGKVVYLDCIGSEANYIAIKSTIMLRGYFAVHSKSLNIDQIFYDLEIDDHNGGKNIKTAIRWTLSQNDLM